MKNFKFLIFFISIFFVFIPLNLLSQNKSKFEKKIIGSWEMDNVVLVNIDEILISMDIVYDENNNSAKTELQNEFSKAFVGMILNFNQDYSISKNQEKIFGTWNYNDKTKKVIIIDENNEKVEMEIKKIKPKKMTVIMTVPADNYNLILDILFIKK